MHAAHEIDGPTVAHAILTTGELIAAFAAGRLHAPDNGLARS
jgi:hypothetical protein